MYTRDSEFPDYREPYQIKTGDVLNDLFTVPTVPRNFEEAMKENLSLIKELREQR
jgi:hypothetical protein